MSAALASALLAVALLAFVASPSPAGPTAISAVTGAVQEVTKNMVVANGNLTPGNFSHPTRIRIFREQLNLELIAPLSVDAQAPGTYGTPLTPGIIPAGTFVSSFLIHSDPGGTAHLTGTVHFDQNILGVILQKPSLDASDPALAIAGVTYPTGNGARGLELSGGGSLDQVVLSHRQLDLDLFNSSGFDEIRVILRSDGKGVTFSFDGQSPTFGVPGAFGGPLFSGDILTVGAGGGPGPNAPVAVPGLPGSMADAPTLGMAAAPGGRIELDALSFGRDAGTRLLFSVDEWAAGQTGGVAPDVRSEGAAHKQEAAADMFALQAPFGHPGAWAAVYGNRQTHDGNGGGTLPAFGLVEPTTFGASITDPGDNLDAVDVGTIATDLNTWIFFSVDGNYSDPAEGPGSGVNYGTAGAMGISGADILVNKRAIPPAVPGPPMVYRAATLMGLDPNLDDIDALMILEDEVPGIFPFPTYTAGSDRVYFSVRRGSGVIGLLDHNYGIPISEADVPEPAMPTPGIVLTGEALGLVTERSGGPYVSGFADDLDAMDLVYPAEAPDAIDDKAWVAPAAQVHVDVAANDLAPYGAIDRASLRLYKQPLHGFITSVDSTGFVYQHDGSSNFFDVFNYVVRDANGESSEPGRVEITVDSRVDVGDGGAGAGVEFRLAGPNPSRDGSRIAFTSPKAGTARVGIFDVHGRLVRDVFGGNVEAGRTRIVDWDGRDDARVRVGGGIYFARLQVDDIVRTLRLVRLP
jgi:hypothetical protein